MTSRIDLEALAARVEAAEAADRELDREIWLACIATEQHRELVRVGGELHGVDEARFRSDRLMDGKSYTASIDAALQLVPGGSVWSLYNSDDPSPSVWKSSVMPLRGAAGESINIARTPALALCAAALRARASQ